MQDCQIHIDIIFDFIFIIFFSYIFNCSARLISVLKRNRHSETLQSLIRITIDFHPKTRDSCQNWPSDARQSWQASKFAKFCSVNSAPYKHGKTMLLRDSVSIETENSNKQNVTNQESLVRISTDYTILMILSWCISTLNWHRNSLIVLSFVAFVGCWPSVYV